MCKYFVSDTVGLARRSPKGEVGGLSSAGRAVALQASGHRFDPDRLHHSRHVVFDEKKKVSAMKIADWSKDLFLDIVKNF